MSAVPGNILDFSQWGGSNYDPLASYDTLQTDYSVRPLSYGVPNNVVNTPRSDGVTWSGVLNGVSSTADTLLQTFGKVYQINSSIENAKYSQQVTNAQLENQRASTLGGLELQKTAIDANLQIEKARAGRATKDAITQANSGGAGFVVPPVSKTNQMYLIGGVVIIGALIFFKGKK